MGKYPEIKDLRANLASFLVKNVGMGKLGQKTSYRKPYSTHNYSRASLLQITGRVLPVDSMKLSLRLQTSTMDPK